MICAKSKAYGVELKIEMDSDGFIEIMDELQAIIGGVRGYIADFADEEVADMTIATCGKLAYISDTKEADKVLEEFIEFMKTRSDKLKVEKQ